VEGVRWGTNAATALAREEIASVTWIMLGLGCSP
jgi:hypothetical protein